ncbi:RES domain-containing protein [Pseudomonas sp. RW3S2]|uniref:RES domain-containing protein n=1 Tax=Pseudomonas sp. RW3S2 TaxID=485884 RepID=UPI00164750EF|nr:RES domain-containing protein [Pseudomonas sp. RW3S2]MBC3421344.1 RES domain-containing protein [Pseudomonas sp. RW3S2]
MNFQLRFIPPLTVSFDTYNPIFGVQGYREAIRQYLLPQSNPFAYSLGAVPLDSRTYCKGSVFSRVRRIKAARVHTFMSGTVDIGEFFPPAAKTRMGRFNDQGERKLYLADHPYVALKECGIEPGDYFLFSYFTLQNDTHFVYADPDSGHFAKLLSDLFKSNDKGFYAVINDTAKRYLDFDSHHGIAYDSVKVKKASSDNDWDNIDSITNLVVSESAMPAARLVVGWLAQCDERYRPRYFRQFTAPADGRKRLVVVKYHGNESGFVAAHAQAMKHVRQLRKQTQKRIQLNQYEDVDLTPSKWLQHDGCWLNPDHPDGRILHIAATPPLPPTRA